MLFVCILLTGIVIRILSANHQLQIDEVWSLWFANHLKHPFDAFTHIHHDNNHYLNTLYLWAVGLGQPFGVYHFPSLLAGIAFLIAVSLWAFRHDRLEGCIVALLLSDSFLFVRYSTEARGFIPMTFFGFCAFLAADAFIKRPRLQTAVLFWIAAILAFLWHLTFAEWYVVLLLWTAWKLRTKALLLHLPVLAFLVILWFVDLRFIRIGGTMDTQTMGETLVDAGAILLGLKPDGRPFTVAAWFAGGALLLWLLRELWKLSRRVIADRTLRTVLWMVDIPALLLIAFTVSLYRARLFLPVLFFVLILLARRLTQALRSRGMERIVAACILSAICIANALQIAAFLPHGLSRYEETLQYIIAHDDSEDLTISSHNHSRTAFLLWFYLPRVGLSDAVLTDGTTKPAEWLLTEYVYEHAPVITENAETYRRVEEADVAGNFWALYRRGER